MLKNKDTIIGFTLVAILMIILVVYQHKKQTEQEAKTKAAQKTEQLTHHAKTTSKDSASANQSNTNTPANDTTGAAVATVSNDSLKMVNDYGSFAAAAKGEEKTYTIEDSAHKIVFTNKGAQIKSVELKNYKTYDGKPLILFTDTTNTLSFQFLVNGDIPVDTKDLYFEASDVSPTGITFRASAGDGKYFEEVYALNQSTGLFDFNVNLVGLNKVIESNATSINLNWENTLSRLEKDITYERRYSALYYRYNSSDVDHLSDTKETDTLNLVAPADWISYKQQFFNTTLLSKGQIQKGILTTHYGRNDLNYVKKYTSNLSLAYSGSSEKQGYNFQYYIGPNGFNKLKSYNRDLEDIIKLGPDWWAFSWIKYITRFIIWMFSLLDKLHLNYGIIILLMTLVLKLALHPLTSRSIESAAKMKILAPELAALKEKYGEDQTRMGQEQMKLYQRAGVSPLGGCLPMLLQMPILIAMYDFFPASIELRQQAFLWAHDLSTYDSIINFHPALFGSITHLSLFTVLMTVTSILQAVMNNQMNAMQNQQPGMKYLPYIMPLMLMFLFNSFPAALTYYYLLQNLLGVGHQWVIQKFVINEEKLRRQIEENKKNPKKKSSFMKRLEDIQKQAEQRTKQPKK